MWHEFVDFQFVPAVQALADRAKVALNFDAVAFILGLGYVMGLRSSMILCAGGFLSNLVLVPLIWMIGRQLPGTPSSTPALIPIAKMTATQIFRGYVRFVGVGAIATAGIFGILKSLRIIAGSFSIAARTFRHGEAHAPGAHRPRPVDRDDPGGTSSRRSPPASSSRRSASGCAWCWSGSALTLVFSFFFTSVAANAIATTARNPISGMTMLTDHRVVGGAAALRRVGHERDVLRHGARRRRLHGARGLRPVRHRPEDRLLARLDAAPRSRG